MFVRLVMVVVFLLAGLNLAAAQGRRVALVIGNGGYRNIPRLTNPSHDATLIAQTLQGLGFQLVGGGARIDLDKTAFDAAVRDFGQQVQGADVALFYYSGHGLQVDGRNWLVPLDANPTRVQDLDFQMVDAQLVLHQMEGSGTKLNLMILDACRNNPFGGRGLRGADGGLAQMRAPEGTLISYATQPGNTAADGTGQNSPYTQALAENLRQPGLDVLRMFNQVGVDVMKATGRAQQPWVSSSPLDSVYYLAGPGTNGAVLPNPAPAPAPNPEASLRPISPPTPVPTAVATPGPPPRPSDDRPSSLEDIAWNRLAGKRTRDACSDFLAKYPSGSHAKEAKACITAFDRKQAAEEELKLRRQQEHDTCVTNARMKLETAARLSFGHPSQGNTFAPIASWNAYVLAPNPKSIAICIDVSNRTPDGIGNGYGAVAGDTVTDQTLADERARFQCVKSHQGDPCECRVVNRNGVFLYPPNWPASCR